MPLMEELEDKSVWIKFHDHSSNTEQRRWTYITIPTMVFPVWLNIAMSALSTVQGNNCKGLTDSNIIQTHTGAVLLIKCVKICVHLF